MDPDRLGADAQQVMEEVLGYLNFSSGAPDPRFLENIDRLFARIEAADADRPATEQPSDSPASTWQLLLSLLQEALAELAHRSAAFAHVEQAQAVLHLLGEDVLPGYLHHHEDLLFHQTDRTLFTSFFVGRVCEAVLACGGPWDETGRIVDGALERLNDFIGYRPVAVLRSEQKLQPYRHEWVRPIPLYIRGVGAATGKYRDLIAGALDVLQATDPALMRQAWFDPNALEELALDPRAYDFDHPVNRRPNHHFGIWDPNHLTDDGRYDRFVLQQVTLDAMLERIEARKKGRGKLPHKEALFEAASVLAGTILMASAIGGDSPGAHDSQTTLASLLPRIAGYRDAFYEQLLARMRGARAKRLRTEAETARQPFGGARQDLNQRLARRRATQLQHVQLAQLFARMGYTEAASRQAAVVPVASARMQCEISCRLTAAHLAADRGQLDGAAESLPRIVDLLHRGIQCGAMVDPWNILGFGGQFPLFPAVENSVPDQRIDELIELIDEIFELHARLEKEAAAAGRRDLQETLSDSLLELAQWWDKYAAPEVGGVDGISGQAAWEAARHVATAVGAWHEAGTAAGDIAFWRGHVDRFQSPEAYALVVEALLERSDPVASMALLMQWLSHAEEISLAEGAYSFHDLAVRWMRALWQCDGQGQALGPARDAASSAIASPEQAADCWARTCKFFDYLEANAQQYWNVPRLEVFEEESPAGDAYSDALEDLFEAAYEDVTYRDSTDDGFEGETAEGGTPVTDLELILEADRIGKRLGFLWTVARLWNLAATASRKLPTAPADRDDVLAGWFERATANHRQLSQLLTAVHRYRIPAPSGTHDSMVEYDRHTEVKESLLEHLIAACVEMSDAAYLILASMSTQRPSNGLGQWAAPALPVLRGLFCGDVEQVRAAWPKLLGSLAEEPLLYVTVARGGRPKQIVAARCLQQLFSRLLVGLPRMGLLSETFQLLETAQKMERAHPVGPGAVTEFDRLFEIAYKAIVQCMVVSSEVWQIDAATDPDANDTELTDCLERATEPLLRCWLAHSRNIRLSVLESVSEERRWRKLRQFIERYGHDIFTQRFMNAGNLRAILHQGTHNYLAALQELPDGEEEFSLLEDLDAELPRDEAARHLEVALEAVLENYPAYLDYNSTTTQSDRGEMLYTLLDFLRLRAGYDRVAWNLRPVVLAHEVLVRSGREKAAGLWKQAVAKRTGDVAKRYLDRFARLREKYGMRLPSIGDRLGERFIRPLAVDQLRALVGPAFDELREDRPTESFKLLEERIEDFTREPSGVGYDVPAWLESLGDEIDDVTSPHLPNDLPGDPRSALAQTRLSRDEIRRQIDQWE